MAINNWRERRILRLKQDRSDAEARIKGNEGAKKVLANKPVYEIDSTGKKIRKIEN